MGIQSQPSDRSLDRFRSRFEAAFDAHHVEVLAFASRRVDGRAAAEDIVAETFAVVWRRRELIPDVPLAWIYAIARRVIANQRRSARRGLRLRERLAREPGTGVSDPAQVVEAREGILAAFARLSEPEREVLRLVAWDDVDTTAGAEIFDCSPVAFRMRLHRARAALKRQLESSHDFPEPAPGIPTRPSAAEEAR